MIYKSRFKESRKITAYHISKSEFEKFKDGFMGNRGTILDAFYFLNKKSELFNFGHIDDYVYTVSISPKKLFIFDLNDEGWTSLDFQEKWREKQVGYENELDEYLEDQDIDDCEEVDCIQLHNLEHAVKRDTIEYIVFPSKIIRIVDVVVFKNKNDLL